MILAARLTIGQRMALCTSALASLEPDLAEAVAFEALPHAGEPIAPFISDMNEARTWASFASTSEKKAYALAAYEALNASDQAAFFQHITKSEAAA